jgi:cytochrome bd-type quinol oxidase subunit 2
MSLTLLQMMKLVAAFAFASAYVLPLVRLAEAGIATWLAMVMVGAIGIPLVLGLIFTHLLQGIAAARCRGSLAARWRKWPRRARSG